MAHQYALRKMPWRIVGSTGMKHIVRITNLPAEILLKIFGYLKKDPVSSACLGLASRHLYEYHVQIHGLGVSLMQDPCFTGLRGQSCGCFHLGVLLHGWMNKHVDLEYGELPLSLSVWDDKFVKDDCGPTPGDTICKDLAMRQAWGRSRAQLLTFEDFKYIRYRQDRWVVPFNAVAEDYEY